MTQAEVRTRTRVVRAHSRLRQDDCGGSANACSDDAKSDAGHGSDEG